MPSYRVESGTLHVELTIYELLEGGFGSSEGVVAMAHGDLPSGDEREHAIGTTIRQAVKSLLLPKS